MPLEILIAEKGLLGEDYTRHPIALVANIRLWGGATRNEYR